jgi:hypothetical protein
VSNPNTPKDGLKENQPEKVEKKWRNRGLAVDNLAASAEADAIQSALQQDDLYQGEQARSQSDQKRKLGRHGAFLKLSIQLKHVLASFVLKHHASDIYRNLRRSTLDVKIQGVLNIIINSQSTTTQMQIYSFVLNV